MDLDGQARKKDGYAMAALLAALGVLAVLSMVAMPTWRQAMQREKEEELVFRGKQYARAISLFQRKFANAFPLNYDLLVEQRFLRKKYKDPMTEDGEFQVLYQLDLQQAGGRQQSGQGTSQAVGQSRGSSSAQGSGAASTGIGFQTGSGSPRGGVVGVVSKSTSKSIRLYNGRNYYNEWQFVFVPVAVGPGGLPGSGTPGRRPGQPGAAGTPGGGRRPGGVGGLEGPPGGTVPAGLPRGPRNPGRPPG
jgi:type II secretory pathway pseudopilin PulG